jgi:hypothetical protein
MLSRILTIAFAAGTLAFATAHAQTGSSGGTGTGATGSTSGTGMGTSTPGSSTNTMGTGNTGNSTGSMGAGNNGVAGSAGSGAAGTSGSGVGSSPQTARQPADTGSLDASQYKSRTECLNAAEAAHASREACNSLH